MKALDGLLERISGYLTTRQVDAKLIRLAKVAQIDGSQQAAALERDAFVHEMSICFLLQAPVRGLERRGIEVVLPLDHGGHIVGLEIDRQQTEGGDIARVGRDDRGL